VNESPETPLFEARGIGYVPETRLGHAAVEIAVLGEKRRATVLAEPVWDPGNERIRA